jgi:RecA-family ATPase
MGLDFNDHARNLTPEEIQAELDDLEQRKRCDEHRRIDGKTDKLNNSVPLEMIKPMQWQGKAIPQRRWLVQDRIPMRQTTLLTGDGGLGKTLLALQLQTACALGRDWIDLKAEPVKSIGFYCEEEEDELHRRMDDILQHYDADFGDLKDMLLTGRAGEDNFIVSATGNGSLSPTALYDALSRKCIDFGAQLVIIDTAADVFDGNEIIRREVRAFISLLQRLAMAIDGAVVLYAHPSQAGMNSGRGDSG